MWNMASKRKQGSGAHISRCGVLPLSPRSITASLKEDKAGRGKADDNVVDIFDFLVGGRHEYPENS